MCGIKVVFHFHNSDSISDHVDTLAKQYDRDSLPPPDRIGQGVLSMNHVVVLFQVARHERGLSILVQHPGVLFHWLADVLLLRNAAYAPL